MIDFRYHVVSIVAVFLALAVGIVLGTTTLNGPATDFLRKEINSLRSDKQDLRDKVTAQEQQLKNADGFVTTVTPALVSGRLSGQRITLVSAPGTPDGLRKQARAALLEAGATVVADVRLSAQYVDPAQTGVIDELAARLAQPGLAFPSDGTTYDRAGMVLAEALLEPPARGDRPGTQPQLTEADVTALEGLREAKLIDTGSDLPVPGSMGVLLVPAVGSSGTPTDGQAAKTEVTALDALAEALDAAGSGAAVAGPVGSADNGGALAGLRASGADKNGVSTVDDLDTPAGQVALVFALLGQLENGSGDYGTGRGASAPLPSPLPGAPTSAP